MSPVVAGFVQRYFGWHMAFLCGAISLFIGLFVCIFFRKAAQEVDVSLAKRKVAFKNWIKLTFGLIASAVVFALLIYKPEIFHIFFIISIFAADEAKNCNIDSDWLFAGFICPEAGHNKTQDHRNVEPFTGFHRRGHDPV